LVRKWLERRKFFLSLRNLVRRGNNGGVAGNFMRKWLELVAKPFFVSLNEVKDLRSLKMGDSSFGSE
jgi:hypothetical protein